MKAVLQRVSRASVTVGDEVVARIGPGLAVLLGVADGDSERDALFLADKTTGLRIFSDQNGRFNLSIKDMGGEVLVVSQFTLLAEARKGRRPSFTGAAPPSVAEPLIARYVEMVAASGVLVATGRFGAHMLVEIINDGPVTILLDSQG